MKPLLSNPPWADKIIGTHWAAIERVVGLDWMPRKATEPKEASKLRSDLAYAESNATNGEQFWVDEVARIKVKLWKLKNKKPKGYVEYGCGHYGCVMPTNKPGVVFKITTDATEAAFIAAYLSWKPHLRPDGIVRYHRILAIRTASHLKRPVFLVWRDEANHLGSAGIAKWISTEAKDFEREYYRRSLRKTEDALGNCLDAAREVRRLTHRKPDAAQRLKRAVDMQQRAWELGERGAYSRDPIMRMAFQLQRFESNATEMENEPMGAAIGRALRECLTDHGLLLADVHLNNIGMAANEELINDIGRVPIITDPGHAIAIDDRYKGVTIEELETAVATNPPRGKRGAPLTKAQEFEALWGAYIAKMQRVDELKDQGRHGFQLRMPKKAVRIAHAKLQSWCDANGVECP